MFIRLLEKYPNAITALAPNYDDNYVWFKDNDQESFIGIPAEDLTEKEISLLHTLFPLDNNNWSLSNIANEWREFLLHNGPLPQSNTNNIRFIHFTITDIRDEFLFSEWEEAIKSLFYNDVTIVPITNQQGVIIEEESNVAITEEELFSAIQAFESDFFIKIYFYIGHFLEQTDALRSLYQLERNMLELSFAEYPEDRIFTREKLMPLYLYRQIPASERNILFADVQQLLADDKELLETIKVYIENQSNATLTAKQLFMHRNSLQYRIDKFIEKTGIDIKTFHGAFFGYLACIFLEMNRD
ncbi:MAG TPA: helix-turn-helix domain-containing protein [Bacillaceae bacterium]|nr:helix-turn-helix domain-containing protein [Paenibacillus bovis]HLU21115.1 helix-turn-helix domain-containing protein [Bacillaceae bacterium]